MNLHLLDAGFDIGLGDVILVLGIILLAIVLVEAFALLLMKFNPSFGKCFMDAFLANLATALCGYLAGQVNLKISIGSGYIPGILLAFVFSVIVEGFILMALNQKKTGRQIWKASLIINLVSYGALVLIALVTSL